MLLPLGDDDRSLTGTPYVTRLLLITLALVFFVVQDAGRDAEILTALAAVPFELTTGIDLVGPVDSLLEGENVTTEHRPGPVPLTIFSALFLHAGIVHLGGNALLLWIFGNNVELRMGWPAFLGLFITGGVAGVAAHVLAEPSSTIPLIGASGSAAAILGAYVVLWPKNRVYVLFLFRLIAIPAVVAIGLWAALQAVSAVGLAVLVGGGTGAARASYTGHLGGLALGIVAGTLALWRERRTAGQRERGRESLTTS